MCDADVKEKDTADHSRGLCGLPDLSGYGLSKKDIESLSLPRDMANAQPPPCQCCNHAMRVVDMSISFGMLGMYKLECDICPPHKH